MVPKHAPEAFFLATCESPRTLREGNGEPENSTFRFGDLLSAVQVLAAARSDALYVQLGCELPRDRIVAGDLWHIRQVLGSLLENAIECTAGGQVRLSIAQEGGRAEFAIAGLGCRMFKGFSGCSFTRRLPGHTLSNLENAQETAKRMGGKITLICGAREGPLIKFVLPLRHSPVDVPNPGGNSMHTPAAAAPRAAVAPYLILVAEDHPINLKLLLALLQAAGCETRCAENGREAVAMLDSTEFDLVVMDSQMPVMTGLEAIALIRSRTDWKRFIPILSLTANAMKGAEEIHTSAGADLYMSKPLRSDCFIGAVKDLARRGRDLRSKQADR